MGKTARSMKKGAAYSVIGLVVASHSGCGGSSSPLPSGSFTTNSIFAYMTAVQDESGTVTTTAQLRDSNSPTANYIFLSSGETLYSTLDKAPQDYVHFSGNLFGNSQDLSQHLNTMARRDRSINYYLFSEPVYGQTEYFTTFVPSSGTVPRVYIDFERSSGWTGASSIDLPGAFQISSPASASTHKRTDPLTLSWNNADATTTMTLNIAGICSDNNRYTKTLSPVADTGTATLNSADYFPASGVSPTATCLTAFILQRSRIGFISSSFATGSFTAVQQRTVQFTTTQ